MRERNALRHFHVAPELLASPEFAFPDEEAEHAARVLRLRSEEIVTAVDGIGNGARVRLRVEGPSVFGVVVERFRSEAEPGLRLTLAIGLVKGSEMDDLVERAAEIGVAAILPVACARSAVRAEGAREGARLDRWRRLARSGMKVARGASLMQILPVVSTAEAAAAAGRTGRSWLLARSAVPLVRGAGEGDALAAIGPEGGFTDEETALFLRAGARAASLGPRNLRTGTAALAAASILLASEGGSEGGHARGSR
jgi:16S rRNA (uracil1498-N3)-methyltransferase